jgi:hypothetical protein
VARFRPRGVLVGGDKHVNNNGQVLIGNVKIAMKVESASWPQMAYDGEVFLTTLRELS